MITNGITDMKRWIMTVFVLTVFSGCQTSVPEAREEANKRWMSTRAKLLYSVATEHLKVGQLDLAYMKVQDSLRLDPEFREARVLLAKILIEQGNYSAAIVQLETARSKGQPTSEICYLMGAAQEKDNKLEEALASYRNAYAIDNSNIAPVTAASEVLVSLGRIREAQLTIESYMNQAGSDPVVFEIAGRIAMMQSEYEKSLRYYQQASDLDMQNQVYRESLAKAQFFAERYNEAVETLKELALIDRYSEAAWVYTMLGDCYLAMEQPIHARDVYQVASSLQPDSAGVWINLAKAAIAMKDYPRAIISGRQALALERRNLDAVLVLGYALILDGQASHAVDVLSDGVRRHPQSTVVLCLLGRAHSSTGNTTDAVKCFKTALKIDPENELAKELLTRAADNRISKLSNY